MRPSWCRSLRLLFLTFLLVPSAAALPPSPRKGSRSPTPRELSTATADALLVRTCDPRSSHLAGVPPLSLCRGLQLRRRYVGGRHHHRPPPVPVPLPPPDRGGEEEKVDGRYGVAKRLVATGPNPLHN